MSGRFLVVLLFFAIMYVGAALEPPSVLLMVIGVVGAAWAGWPVWKKVFGLK